MARLPRLLSEKCGTCVFRPDSPFDPATRQRVIRANLATGSLLTCHDTLPYGEHPDVGEALCRGFWDAHGHRSHVKAQMDALFPEGWTEEVDPPS